MIRLCTVDVTDSGFGDLDVEVVSNDVRIPTQIQALNVARHRYTFIPMSPFNHVVTVKYNDDDVPGKQNTLMGFQSGR